MEYIRPIDLKKLHPDTLHDMREQLNAEQHLIQQLLDGQVESVCSFCASTGYGYDDIPDDWAYVVKWPNTLLCNNCLGRFYEKLDLPELTRELEL